MHTITDQKKIACDLVFSIQEALTDAGKVLDNASYESGLLGLSLFYSYYARFTGDESWYALAEKYLDEGLDKLNSLSSFRRVYSTDSLDNHLANVGRFLEFSKKNGLLDMDTNSYLDSVDGILLQLMESKIALGDFDLNSGAFASGYYFLARSNSNPGLIEHGVALVKGIEEKAMKDEDGYYYWTSPSLYNKVFFGISHGSAMIILMLANLYDRGIEQDACQRIIHQAAGFILKHQRTQKHGLFPLSLDDNLVAKPFSLCYGDPGVGYALYQAGRVTGNALLQQAATMVLDASVTRKREPHAPGDASLIYGASGIVALYEKLYLLTNEERYYAEVAYWYGQIPGYAIYPGSYAGFNTMLRESTDLWNLSFGWGVIGIGLTLMRYANPELPAFHDLLMIA